MSTRALLRTVEWRSPTSHPHYEVSSGGAVRNSSGRVLKPWVDPNGYLKIRLSGPRQTFWVHRLVAAAFHGSCPEGLQVRHLDGDKLNNSPENLRYGTASENAWDRSRHGTNPSLNRTECPQGHSYDEANTRWYRGRRQCRTCRNAVKRAAAARMVGITTECDACGRVVSVGNLRQHKKTERCKGANDASRLGK